MGTVELSPRQLECLKLTALGKTHKEIGLILRMSERTARFHIDLVKKKLGVYNMPAAVARAYDLKILGAVEPN